MKKITNYLKINHDEINDLIYRLLKFQISFLNFFQLYLNFFSFSEFFSFSLDLFSFLFNLFLLFSFRFDKFLFFSLIYFSFLFFSFHFLFSLYRYPSKCPFPDIFFPIMMNISFNHVDFLCLVPVFLLQKTYMTCQQQIISSI